MGLCYLCNPKQGPTCYIIIIIYYYYYLLLLFYYYYFIIIIIIIIKIYLSHFVLLLKYTFKNISILMKTNLKIQICIVQLAIIKRT